MRTLLACTTLVLVGCGGGGPTRFSLTGEATMGGELVPAGEVHFEPDTSKGNGGPGTVARIENGRLRLSREKGHVGGPHKLRITVYDGNGDPNSMDPFGKVLVYNHVVERDLPRENGTFNLSLLPLEELLAKESTQPAAP